MLRILHVGLGPLGCLIATDLHARRLGRIVAAVDCDPKVAGRELRELVPGAQGIVVGCDLEPALDGEVDCALVTTCSSLPGCAATLRPLLARGLTVVSTCEELVWPWLRHAALAEELDQLARAHGGRLLGTGVNPGFLMDTLPAVVSTMSRTIARFDCWRIQDATPRRLSFQRKIGAGLDLATFAERVASGELRHVGLGESLHFTAHCLGLELDRFEESIEPVPAKRNLDCALGRIRPGQIAGVRQVATGYRGERPIGCLEFIAAVGQRNPHDRVRLEGEPPIDLTIAGGVHGDIATSAVVLNVIPSLCAAPPGLHTMASIPLVHRTASRPA